MDENTYQEPTIGSEQEPQADPYQNLKAEYDRKLSNLQSQFDQSHQQLVNLIQTQWAQAQTQYKPDTSASDDPIDLYDSDGQKKFLGNIDKIVSDRISQGIRQYEDRTIKQHQIYQDFPELQDPNSKFTQTVSSMYAALTPEQKQDDNHFQTIIYQVAAQQGLKPKRFRDSDTDDFTLGARRGEKNVAPKKDPESQDGIDRGSLAWMEVLQRAGAPVDPKDKAQLEKLREFSKRKQWTKRHTSPEFRRPGVK